MPQSAQTDGFFDYLLLAACVAVVACRATLTEAPGIAATAADSIFNTATSAFLILATMSWFVSNLCKKQFALSIQRHRIRHCDFFGRIGYRRVCRLEQAGGDQ